MVALLAIAGLVVAGLIIAAILAGFLHITQAIDDAFDGLGNVNGSPSHSEELPNE
jgi:Flp pilus assembly pilin Flp